jgi:acyl carrier protein
MTPPLAPDQVRQTVFRLLGEIAPEADLAAVKPDVSFRDQLDIDSIDFLNFVVSLHKQFQIDVPESDYSELATIDGCVRYLERKLAR